MADAKEISTCLFCTLAPCHLSQKAEIHCEIHIIDSRTNNSDKCLAFSWAVKTVNKVGISFILPVY